MSNSRLAEMRKFLSTLSAQQTTALKDLFGELLAKDADLNEIALEYEATRDRIASIEARAKQIIGPQERDPDDGS